MGAPNSTQQQLPPASALQNLLEKHPVPQDASYATDYHNLALQIAHNLHYQHLWTNVHIHTHSTKDSSVPLPRPIVSGLPPRRLYVHPDEQIELLQKQKDEGKSGMPDLTREREWVLPSHLREKWSLRRFGEVFDRIDAVPLKDDGKVLFGELAGDEAERNIDSEEKNQWRLDKPKRLVLATLDDDSTVVYYIVHDGIVKPRQN